MSKLYDTTPGITTVRVKLINYFSYFFLNQLELLQQLTGVKKLPKYWTPFNILSARENIPL